MMTRILKVSAGILLTGSLLASLMVSQAGSAARKSPPISVQPVAVQMDTSFGSIVVEVYPAKAPATSAAFLDHVQSGKYEGAGFFRSVKADNDNSKPNIQVLQGGVLSDDGSAGYRPIGHESTRMSGLRHVDGAISLARGAVGTASANSFFISIGAQPSLDFGGMRNPDGQGFAAFGKVICGMDVVRKIHRMPTTGQSPLPVMNGQMFDPPIRIDHVRIVKNGCGRS